ncbi:YhcB family protein [Thalassotalea fusca]
MSIILGIGIFILGGIAGFLANRFYSSQHDAEKLREQVTQSDAALAQYKLDVAEHLDNSTQLLEQMNQTCQKAMQQMETSTKLLQQATPDINDAMPFFSKETQEQLAKTVNLRHDRSEKKTKESLSEPPLDYSAGSSGLFEGKKHSVTNAETSE